MAFGRRQQPQKRVTTILIVEDEPLVAFDTEHILTEEGFVVAGAVDNAAGAIALLASEVVHLVLADVSLSRSGEGDGGIVVARAAQAKGIPVLFISGNCPIDARALALGCLAKPYRPRDLIEALEAIETVLAGGIPKRVPRALSLYAGQVPSEG